MALFEGAAEGAAQELGQALLLAVNVFLNRIQDEILAKKKIKITIEVEDKEPTK